MRRSPPHPIDDQHGFMLIELLIAIALSVIVLGTVGGILLAVEHGTTTSTNRSEALQTLDTAMQRLTVRLRQAAVPSSALGSGTSSGYSPAVPVSLGGAAGTGVGSSTAYTAITFYLYEGAGAANALHRLTYQCTGQGEDDDDDAADPGVCYVLDNACRLASGTNPCTLAPPGYPATVGNARWQLQMGCPNGADADSDLGACANLTTPYVFADGLQSGAATWTSASAQWSAQGVPPYGLFPVTVAIGADVKQDPHSRVFNNVSLVQTVTPHVESCSVTACSN